MEPNGKNPRNVIEIPKKHWARTRREILNAHDAFRDAVYERAKAIHAGITQTPSPEGHGGKAKAVDWLDRAFQVARSLQTNESDPVTLPAIDALKWRYNEKGVVLRTSKPGVPSRRMLDYNLETRGIQRRDNPILLVAANAPLVLDSEAFKIYWSMDEGEIQTLLDHPVWTTLKDSMPKGATGIEDLNSVIEERKARMPETDASTPARRVVF